MRKIVPSPTTEKIKQIHGIRLLRKHKYRTDRILNADPKKYKFDYKMIVEKMADNIARRNSGLPVTGAIALDRRGKEEPINPGDHCRLNFNQPFLMIKKITQEQWSTVESILYRETGEFMEFHKFVDFMIAWFIKTYGDRYKIHKTLPFTKVRNTRKEKIRRFNVMFGEHYKTINNFKKR